jgi:hypothetical protein
METGIGWRSSELYFIVEVGGCGGEKGSRGHGFMWSLKELLVTMMGRLFLASPGVYERLF